MDKKDCSLAYLKNLCFKNMAFISSLKKDQVNQTAKEVYQTFEDKSGSVPEWVKVMAHRPEILKEFVELFNVVMKEGEIDNLLKWKIAYVVSQTLKCKFCVDVTEKMLEKFGATKETIQSVKNLENLQGKEKNILELVKDVTLDGHLDQPQIFEELKEQMTEPQLVEVISVIGLFNYINRFNNTLAIFPV